MPVDFRLVLRSLWKAPGFTLVSVATLALGIGANTAIFSVVNRTLLESLPYPDAHRLAQVVPSNPKRNLRGGALSVGAYEFFRDRNHSFSTLAGTAFENATLTGDAEAEQVPAARITSNLLPALRTSPARGRNFLPDEDRPGGAPVAIISHKLWQRRFAADPHIAGRTVILNGAPHTVIGVMPAGFEVPAPNLDVWLTNLAGAPGFTAEQIRLGAGFITFTGRLRDGVTARQASADFSALAREYQRDNPGRVDADPDIVIEVVPLAEERVQGVRTMLLVLAAAVGFVLLIACGNVAALLLARASTRSREIAIRAALGAGRRALAAHILAEAVVLAILSGAAGLLLASWGTSLLGNLVQDRLPGSLPVQQDVRVLLFTLAVSILTGIVFGLAPSLHISRPDLAPLLRDGARGASDGRQRRRIRSLLVVTQVALSIVLLVGAGLLLRSFVALAGVDAGFDPGHMLTLRVTLPPARYATDTQRTAYFERAQAAIDSLPGVTASGAVYSPPLQGRLYAMVIRDTDPRIQFARRPLALWQAATPGYFEAMRIRLLSGRTFTAHDRADSPKAAIVNQTMAKQFWPNQNPLGKRILVGRAEIDCEVVGVIADVKSNGLDTAVASEMYTVYAQRTWPGMTMVVRTQGDPHALALAVRERMAGIDRDQPVTDVLTGDELVAAAFGPRRVMLWLIGAFAGIAVLLAVVGLYGSIAYSVVERRREIGIRVALGAGFGEICRSVLGDGLKLVVIGAAIGTAGALALTRLMTDLLFAVKPADPAVFAAALLLFAAVALIASYFPAAHAARMDPVAALRGD